jgi:GNAT superfamily N-acetyltransferase
MVNVRPSTAADREFVLRVAERLAAFGPPEWRTCEEIVSREGRTLREYFERSAVGASLLVAESDGVPSGFVFLETVEDYFTGARHGHVGMLAVSAEAEGTGAGRALMDGAEEWAKNQGFAKLTLNVFAGNARARAVYEHLDYRPETLRYVKLLGPR